MAEPISRHVADGVGLVADAFAADFDDPGEVAAAVSVVHDRVIAVDLWGGTDVVYDRPMQPTPWPIDAVIGCAR